MDAKRSPFCTPCNRFLRSFFIEMGRIMFIVRAAQPIRAGTEASATMQHQAGFFQKRRSEVAEYARVAVLVVLWFVMGAGPSLLRAQSIDRPFPETLEAACAGGGHRIHAYMLHMAMHQVPLRPSQRAALHPDTRAALRLVEAHYRPYRDPQTASTWTGRFPYAILQGTLPVRVAPDTSFARWEAADYALSLDWDTPLVVRQHVLEAFRPRLSMKPIPVYLTSALRDPLDAFLLPMGVMDSNVMEQRIACLSRVVGLTDWGRTSNDLQSPPTVGVLLNERRTRAIVSFDWGTRGGVWVLYRREAPRGPWREVRPIGAWRYGVHAPTLRPSLRPLRHAAHRNALHEARER